MIRIVVVAVELLVMASASAGTTCVTRRSGSVVIESCSDSGHSSNYRQCRSYRSGSVWKKSCRS